MGTMCGPCARRCARRWPPSARSWSTSPRSRERASRRPRTAGWRAWRSGTRPSRSRSSTALLQPPRTRGRRPRARSSPRRRAFDIAYLRCLPNIVLMAPRDEAMLVHMLRTALLYDDGPIALRYPRGEGTGVALPREATEIPIGRGEILREGGAGAASGRRVALVGYGGGVGKGPGRPGGRGGRDIPVPGAG